MCSGKKDHLRHVQKRYLSAPLKDLYRKYCTHTSSKMSFRTFQRIKPFWIVKPKLSNRDTCACQMHENFQFLVDALYEAGLISVKNSADILNIFCCTSKNELCIYRKCSKCSSKKALTINQQILTDMITYFQYARVTEKRNVKGVEKMVPLTKRLKLTATVSGLIDLYNK